MTPSRARRLAFLVGGLACSVGCSGSSASPGGGDDSSGGGTGLVDAGRDARSAANGAASDGASSTGPGTSGDPSDPSDAGTTGRADGASTAEAGATDAGGKGLWRPTTAAPIHFHWMINGFKKADLLSNQAGIVVYDIDGENATAADVAAIHAAGAIAVCYVDVGSIEKGRSDYAKFPASVVGPGVDGWPGENWFLVTAANQPTILPLMKARFETWCQAKGFDAIEPDNLDGWSNISGITQADNLAYDLAIAQLAHALPLSIGLKNLATNLGASDLTRFVSAFDWALNEQCSEYGECDAYTKAGSFLPAGKAVFDVEYNAAPDCTQANKEHLNAQKTDLDLVGATASGYAYTPCVPDTQATWP